jgi:hypothetical protein
MKDNIKWISDLKATNNHNSLIYLINSSNKTNQAGYSVLKLIGTFITIQTKQDFCK